MQQPIRVLVVDDSTFMRGALVRMIEKDARFKVIDIATNGREGVDKATSLRPDVITMDVEMPVMNGIEALKEIMNTIKLPVIMVSTLTESGAATTMQALELGAVDFIPKALQDKDKNIFRGAEVIHEKLLAAAGAKVRHTVPTTRPATPVAPVPMAGPLVHRVAAKVVVIGSSTGGPRALQNVLQALPKHFPLPVVVAQHMPPTFTDALAKRLDETCAVAVVQATQGELLMPGKVYIAPGGQHLRVGAGMVADIRPEAGESPYKPSVDVLAESVLQQCGKQVLAVMLTGMGNDGARAFLALKQQGAHVIAQDQDSCVVYGMPKSVVENGAASESVTLESIGGRICQLVGV